MDSRKSRKGKTFEEIYGTEKAAQMKASISKTLTQKNKGENNPFFGKKHSLESKKKMGHSRGKTYEEMHGYEGAEIRKNKIRKPIRPRNYHTEYDDEFFNVKLRQNILKEQYYLCGICLEKLGPRFKKNLHHINYIKKDNCRKNLMYLCVSCHSRTNFHRDLWENYLKRLNHKIISTKQLSRKIIYRIRKTLTIEEKNNLLDNGGYIKWQT